MPRARINGVGLYYEVNGQGPPLLLGHGFAGTARMWDTQVRPLSQRHEFITYDLRGHGQTETPPSLSQYSVDIVVEDMSQLLRLLGIKRGVIGGLSLGGYLALHFYFQHKEMVTALLLIDTGPGYRSEKGKQQWNARRIACAELLEKKGIVAFADSEYAINDYYTPRELMLTLNPIGLANVSRGVMLNPALADRLSEIDVPTLIVVGERDTGFLEATDYMHKHIRNSKKVVIANAGHGVNVDQPEVFNSTVLNFLKAIGI